ncbi:MAG: condensation domain-containing protein, partial [Steroidobacteraceae bacterium]
ALGDAIEVKALEKVFGDKGQDADRIPLGAVKSNLGHPEGASAIAQLCKVILQMRHGEIAPTRAPAKPNPHMSLESTPFIVLPEPRAWNRRRIEAARQVSELPRRALINSFGAGGSNVSLLVEEWPFEGRRTASPEANIRAQILVFSARTRERLRGVLAEMAAYLASHPGVPLESVAYTLQLCREPMELRFALIAESLPDIVAAIHCHLDGGAQKSEGGLHVFEGAPLEDSALRNILDGAIGTSVIEAAVAARRLDKIALLWTQGQAIPWRELWGERPPARVRLPGYPFARVSLVRSPAAVPSAAVASDANVGGQPHRGALRAALFSGLAKSLGVAAEQLHPRMRLRALGIDSLALVRLRHSLETQLRYDIPLAVLDRAASVEELETALCAYLPAGACEAAPDDSNAQVSSERYPTLILRPDDRHRPFPLTDLQSAYLAGRSLETTPHGPGPRIYFESRAVTLDIYRLNAAWNRLVAHHDMLRAVILPDERQQVLETVPPYRIKVLDLRTAADGDREQQLRALRARMLREAYDPHKWPSFAIRVSLCPDFHIIHFAIDEVLVDGHSVATLLRDWQTLYEDPGLALPAAAVTFRDVVLSQNAFEASVRWHRDLDYWLRRFESVPGGPEFGAAAQPASPIDSHDRTRLRHLVGETDWGVL